MSDEDTEMSDREFLKRMVELFQSDFVNKESVEVLNDFKDFENKIDQASDEIIEEMMQSLDPLFSKLDPDWRK